jgi:hypothetical protein
MPKKIQLLALVLAGILFLSGCANKPNQNGASTGVQTGSNGVASDETAANADVANGSGQSENETIRNTCQKENVSLPNYGDPGQRLENCFVQYPGEPSRQEKSYYIVEDICGQFTQKFVENLLGKNITKMEPSKISSVYACSYYLDDSEYIMLALDYLKVENQKIGQEAMGRKVEKNPKIPVDNLVVWQEDGSINDVYFILGPEKFLRLERSSKAAIDNDKILDFSAKIGEAIKGYK